MCFRGYHSGVYQICSVNKTCCSVRMLLTVHSLDAAWSVYMYRHGTTNGCTRQCMTPVSAFTPSAVYIYPVRWLPFLVMEEYFLSDRVRIVFRPGYQLSRLMFSVVFFSTSMLVRVEYLKLGHDRFLPHYFRFLIP
jgi:hypothetical protein